MAVAHSQTALRSLRREWAAAALLALVLLLIWTRLLGATSFAPYAARWLALASLASAVVLAVLWHSLRLNRRPNEAHLFTTLGPASWLTYAAGLSVAWLAGFLFSPWPVGWLAWMPALLYLASRLFDLLDGIAARRTGRVTEAGAMLDIEFDGFGLLIAAVLGIQYGQLPIWYLPLAVSRQLFIAGVWWRTRRGKPVYDLPPSDNRRITAGCQTSFIVSMLWPIFGPPALTLAAALFAVPLLASFGRDWLVVSGRIDDGSPTYQELRSIGKQVVERWMPLAARIAGTVVAALLLLRAAPSFTSWDVYLYSFGLQDARAAGVFAVVLAAALPFYALGIVGRLAAIPVMLVAMLDIQASGLFWYSNGLLFACGFVVFHFGSGVFSLWQPEERLLHRQIGAP